MTILENPHPLLTTKLEPLEVIDDRVAQDAASMLLLCKSMNGLGLAANQVGLTYRIFVLPSLAQPVCINPAIVKHSKTQVRSLEGCLSLPGYRNVVMRWNTVDVEYYNLDGELCTAHLEGNDALGWQHELEHLDGILINMKKIDGYSL